jgi:carbamate kinase
MSAKRDTPPLVLVALGGHAFIQIGEPGTFDVHVRNAASICRTLADMVAAGYNIVITHGNGPQVGNLLLLNESGDAALPRMPLDVLVAETEGSLGYFLQQAMINELKSRGDRKYVMTVISQVSVDPRDPAFQTPNKPVGPFLEEAEALRRRSELDWRIAEDAGGRGWRRLVPSPKPKRVVQWRMIRESAEAGHIVIACGGGGIPVVKTENGTFRGVEAVIDKDLTSSILGTQIGAEILVILTQVPYVYTDFNTPEQRAVRAITIDELETMQRQGQFPAGSMGPKIEAAVSFLANGGKRVIVTNPANLSLALEGRAGTHIIGAC